MYEKLRVLTGTAHPTLADDICKHLGILKSVVTIQKFSNENIFVQLNESVRAKDVFIVQPFASDVNEHIMELLILLDTCKRASADRITAVIPYFAYGRSDKKDQPRVPITARLLADLVAVAGANRVVTIDLHAQQIQGFFSIPMDEITALPLLAAHFREKAKATDPAERLDLRKTVVVSPDIGAAKRARDLAVHLGIDNQFAIVNKRRNPKTREVDALSIIGRVAGKHAILIDEEIDTGNSIMAANNALCRAHAQDVYVCCTHPVFSGDCKTIMAPFPFNEIVVTDTLPVPCEKALPHLVSVSVAPLLADVIASIHLGTSLGKVLGEKYA